MLSGYSLKLISTMSLLTLSTLAFSETYFAENAKEVRKYARKLKPGDELVLAEGNWQDQHIEFKAKGKEGNPITLRSAVPGKTVFTGDSYLAVDGEHLVVSGMYFTDGYLKDDHVIEISGENNRLTNSAIVDYSSPDIDTRYFWLGLNGSGHEIDYNYFEGQNHSGVTTVVWLKEKNAGHHHIHHNYFGPRIKGNANGFETIRIGTSSYSKVSASTLVEHNLFEGADGEIEIISNKSRDNVYRFNTFLASAGTLTLRHAPRATVAYNHFIGGGKKSTGGVRIIDADHLIFGNHFEKLGGRADGVISITAGDPKAKASGYQPVKNTVIAANTFTGNRGISIALNVGLGSKNRTLVPENLLIDSNRIDAKWSGTAVISGNENSTVQWAGNEYIGYPLGYSEQAGLKEVKELSPAFALPGCEETVSKLDSSVWETEQLLELCSRTGNPEGNFRPLDKSQVGVNWLN